MGNAEVLLRPNGCAGGSGHRNPDSDVDVDDVAEVVVVVVAVVVVVGGGSDDDEDFEDSNMGMDEVEDVEGAVCFCCFGKNGDGWLCGSRVGEPGGEDDGGPPNRGSAVANRENSRFVLLEDFIDGAWSLSGTLVHEVRSLSSSRRGFFDGAGLFVDGLWLVLRISVRGNK